MSENRSVPATQFSKPIPSAVRVGLFLIMLLVAAVARTDRMPRKQCNLPVKVRCGELTVHPASEDPVLRGNSQG